MGIQPSSLHIRHIRLIKNSFLDPCSYSAEIKFPVFIVILILIFVFRNDR
jgi:hypothetical protein